MHNRKIAAVAGIAALTLAACGSPPQTSEKTKALTIATTSNNQAPMEAVIEAYKKKTGLDVNLTVADTAQYQTTLRTQLSSGTASDVFTVWPGSGNPGAITILQKAGYLADLSDRPWTTKVEPGTAETLRIGGKTYGLPSKLDAIGAIYNAGTLKETGLKVPATYTELLKFCADVKAKGKVAFALGLQTDWVTQLIPYALVASTVYAADPAFNDKMAKRQATFAGSGWEAALAKYTEMNKSGCFNDDPLGTDVTASYSLVNTGKAVGVVQVLASFSQITSAAPKGTEFGFFPLPGGDTGTNPIPRGIGVSFAVNDKAKNRVNALGFVDWLATPEATKAWFGTAPGIPAIQGAEVEAEPAVRAAIDIIAAGKTAPFPDTGWPSAKVQAAHLAGIQRLFSGQADAKQVLASMDEAYGR
ncbi:raffinose/stachyose/melibiose transport system substrate-binding protein [Nonomuraea solani]|uniref:Raffinose/stachyose/melibiose transport system substrate-binding protein n=1 Tax=Nonomuraea solani TaxID=1144553 RepID=A0A1H6DUN3_9ACTN|nr:ABC transporter substrate-binding protein [Nonomuraea solani]SEG89001.1 raffinose/stachyose/melibiose transport system substrate-binding protein [Nonomuraea solani]